LLALFASLGTALFGGEAERWVFCGPDSYREQKKLTLAKRALAVQPLKPSLVLFKNRKF
jgi:hypothetical protein